MTYIYFLLQGHKYYSEEKWVFEFINILSTLYPLPSYICLLLLNFDQSLFVCLTGRPRGTRLDPGGPDLSKAWARLKSLYKHAGYEIKIK